jgi:hypothetical protein
MKKKTVRKAGRPEAIIDWKKVGQYLQAQCNATAIASLLGISTDTLYLRCKKDNNLDFTVFSEQKKGEGKELLRLKLFDQAMGGNTTMGIWLSKQYLGFRDQIEQTITVPQVSVHTLDESEQVEISTALTALEVHESNESLPEEPDGSNG